MPILALKDISKRFGAHQVLDGVSLAVEPGEVVAIIGRSGSGKSTLLRCINGLEGYERGDILVDDIRVDRLDRSITAIRTAAVSGAATKLLARESAGDLAILGSGTQARTHLEALTLLEMTAYLNHHLEVAGVSDELFAEATAQAIHQGSGGFLRKANILARGALIAAAREKSELVTAEHVRLAATELI